MHVLFRETHGLEETAAPRDLGQAPADLVVLSFSDSDLGAFAAGWHRAKGGLPSLRLANLAALAHPLSVDTYVDRTLSGARGILIRLIGGAGWWAYGVEQVSWLARDRGLALAILPADGRPDPALDAASTLPVSTLRRLQALCEAGGEIAAQGALAQLALAAGLYAGPVPGPKVLPPHGLWHPDHGPCADLPGDGPLVAIPFYRAWAAAADTAGIAALIRGFEQAGYRAIGLFVPSLKEPAAADWLRDTLRRLAPVAVVNTTAFSARTTGGSPLDAAGVPVFQAIHATSSRPDWQGADRGLAPSDLAMHVALPEVDGRIGAGVISFKGLAPPDPDLQFTRQIHSPDPEGIAATVARVAGWHRLATTPPPDKRLALVLSTYPGKAHRMAHAVGLDALASAQAMLEDLARTGHDVPAGPPLDQALAERILWPLSAYRAALARLPAPLRQALIAAHGRPEDDPCITQGAFAFAATRRGKVLVALQPDRSADPDREGEYHDMSRLPGHAYVAFYLWLASQVDALVHVGAHGTLEWLPGKAAALSGLCWPQVLAGGLPVIYPFIVNDPGEAAQARRRLGAVTLGHLPPPLATSGTPPGLARLEQLLDEYSTADGLDPARRGRLITAIRDAAQGAGVERDLAIPPGASAAEAIPQIDRFVCDLKESRYGDGLHIWGRGTPAPDGAPQGDPASITAERQALIAALAGQPIAPGPSGSPHRGRVDVLPTGRNLFGTDPRAVPSRTAHTQGIRLAEELLRRHLQDQGDYPRGLVVNLWGSATMRTAGEEFAMALHLAGAAPLWDSASDRVTGFEILPLTRLDRPRIEVTLRLSGLFRDVFPDLARLFQAATDALALRDEAADMNPYVASPGGPRVFAPAPGHYGVQVPLDTPDRAGAAWLEASAHDAQGQPARAMLEQRLRGADALVHPQDLPETDLLLAEDYAAHIGGFAAAMTQLGATARIWHLDSTTPGAPRARPLSEELARILRARASHPGWIAGMMRHGFRGAAEISATLDHMAAFAHLAQAVPPHLFDHYHAATLGTPAVRDFLAQANPGALAAMERQFQSLAQSGLWQDRSNSRAMGLA